MKAVLASGRIDSAIASPTVDRIARALRGDLSWIEAERWDCDDLVAEAGRHGVDIVLWSELRGRPECPEALRQRLAAAVGPEAARAAVRERELARVMRAFASHGVDAIVVKGAALALTCYAKPWLRPRLDTDVLVARAAFDRASAALMDAGYAQSSTFSTGDFVSHQVAFERTDAYGVEHTVDLHWRVLNPQKLAGVVGFDDLRNESWETSVGGVAMRVPMPLWSLLLACTHRLAHHQQQERLIWLYDLHLLAGGLQPSEWSRLLAIARERKVSAICANGLAAAARLFGTTIPDRIVATLAAEGRSDPSRHYVARHVRRLDVLRDDLGELPRWRDRLRLLREHAFPPVAFMRTRYGLQSRLLLPLLYAHRLVTGAYRWIRA